MQSLVKSFGRYGPRGNIYSSFAIYFRHALVLAGEEYGNVRGFH
jgi:hypothetical protein